jgi:hypothetical protein
VDIKVAEEFLDELFSSLEVLETRSTAILQFLKEQGEVTEEELAPYMEQASKASNVRWRAARLRMMSLFSAAVKDSDHASEKSPKQPRSNDVSEKNAQPEGMEKPSGPQAKKTEAEPDKQKAAQNENQEKSQDSQQATRKAEPEAEDRKIDVEAKPESSAQAKQEGTAQAKSGDPKPQNSPEATPRQTEKKDAA